MSFSKRNFKVDSPDDLAAAALIRRPNDELHEYHNFLEKHLYRKLKTKQKTSWNRLEAVIQRYNKCFKLKTMAILRKKWQGQSKPSSHSHAFA